MTAIYNEKTSNILKKSPSSFYFPTTSDGEEYYGMAEEPCRGTGTGTRAGVGGSNCLFL